MRLSALFLAFGCARSADDYTFKLVKKGAECASSDTYHGKKPTLEGCARAFAEHKRSAYFIYGSGTDSKAGDCFSEATRTAACQEGFEDDSFDFYQMSAEWIGCMEPRSSNYDSKALVDSGECTEADACVAREGDGTCRIGNGATRQPVDGGFIGYRNRANDTVYASRVENRAIEVDGDLRDWAGHAAGRTYKNTPFANRRGEEVVFENAPEDWQQGAGAWYAAMPEGS